MGNPLRAFICERSISDPAPLLPDFPIFGIRPAFSRIEVGKFDRKNETAPVRLRPAKFDLAITIIAIYKKLIVFPVGLWLEDFIYFRFRIGIVRLELTEVASLDLRIRFILILFLKFKLPVVAGFERSPFPPALALFSARMLQICVTVRR
jgi:hypothetical protein